VRRSIDSGKATPPAPDDERKARESHQQTYSGIPIAPLYRPQDISALDEGRDLGLPGDYPFTRGIYPSMYRGRLWTMRQYAGFGTAAESNQRYRFLLSQGQKALSVAFDLPTQLGLDSDHPLAQGEVGKVGVAIDSLRDMEALFEGIPLERVSASMTINATAAILLALYVAVARKQGADVKKLSGTVQNDILKEYVARGTYIFPPRPSLRLVTDLFAWALREVPDWNIISISGYHIREAGATAVQEVAFTLSNALAYVDAARAAGLDVDAFAPRLSFFFNAHNNLFEEVAKFRAARRLWARLMKARFSPGDPRSCMLRFHTQTAGSTLAARQPDVNVVRTTLQGLSAVLGGTQSLHTNAKDEALGLPTEGAALLALRTQQVLAYESGIAQTIDPLAGSYFVEALTSEIEARARDYIERIDAMGGVLPAIESGFVQREIQESAFRYQRAVESGEQIVVGVNRFDDEQGPLPPVLRIDPALEKEQRIRLQRLRAERDNGRVQAVLSEVERTARASENLMPAILAAVESCATVGEIAGALRRVFGEYKDPALL
jgi:methylmalonyl-CoA mutase N-terminal domain/subunit